MTDSKQKPQLHQSHLNMLYRCGEQFYRVYILGEKEPPGIALLIGSATHETNQKDLINKMNTGRLLPDSQVKDIARDAFVARWNEGSVLLDEDQRKLGLKKVQGLGIDESVNLSFLYHRELAPKLKPRKDGIERPWVLRCQGYPYDLAGQIDVQTENKRRQGAVVAIRDTKTRTVSPPSTLADNMESMTLYSLAVKILDGREPDEVWLDCLIKGKTPRLICLPGRKRTEADFTIAKNRFERSCEIIEKEVFTPASRSDWWCSEKFCGFAANGTCRFFSKGIGVKIPVTKNVQRGGGRHGGKGKGIVIPAGSERWWDACR